MAVYLAVSIGLFFWVAPKIALIIGSVGFGLGLVCGVLQHLSIMMAPEKFKAAVNPLEVRRAFTSTVWGYRYIWWLYICKATLAVTAWLLVRDSLFGAAVSYCASYALLMFGRELMTLRDAFRLAEPSVKVVGAPS